MCRVSLGLGLAVLVSAARFAPGNAAIRDMSAAIQTPGEAGPVEGPDLPARIASLRDHMGRLSRQIGAARAGGMPVDALLERMKALSAERKQLEAQLKECGRNTHPPGGKGEGRQDNPTPDPQAAVAPRYRRPDLQPGDVSFQAEAKPGEEWDAYVQEHPRATPYHHACWHRVIEEAFGHASQYLVARDANGRLAGVLPAFAQSSRVFGTFLTSLPFVNYGGALGESRAVEEGLMHRATELALAAGCRHAEFRDDLAREGWPARTEKVSMRLALPGSSESLWRDFPSKVRAQVRRAQREQPAFTIGGRELLGEFYAVFSRNMRDLGTPVYAPGFFARVVELAGPDCRVAVLRVAGKPVSGGILVGFRDCLEIPWASTLKDANPLGLNMYFYWSVLEYAITRGYRVFDFGRSTKDSGTFRFKQQWGAVAAPLSWHYGLAEPGALPRLNPQNPKYRLAVAGWRRLPLPIANRLGPLLARSLP